MNITSILTIAVVAIMTTYSIYLLNKEKNKLSSTSGIMAAITVGMMTGLQSGYLIGEYSGDLFFSSGLSMIIGFVIGFLAGQPINILSVIGGALSGLFSGLLGSMLGILLQIENPAIMLGIILGLYVMIISLVIVFIKVESKENFSLDTQGISPFVILSAGIVLVTLFLFLYSSNLVKIPGDVPAQAGESSNSPTTANTKLNVSTQGSVKIKMEVTETGYSPNVIRVKKGVPVEIEFHNQLSNSCLSTFQLPSFNINNFSLNTGITNLTFTPDKTGEYTFSCGMNMYKGTVIVE